MKALRFAVMGNPIAHSLSPQIHQYFARQAAVTLHYDRCLVPREQFEGAVAEFFESGGTGLNITAPFKHQAYQISSVATDYCHNAQAANTLWMSEAGLSAANTDGIGLVRDLKRFVHLDHQSVLILGAGGATSGVIAPLLESGIGALTLANRTPGRVQSLCEAFPAVRGIPLDEIDATYDIVIHATSGDFTQCQSIQRLRPGNNNDKKPFFYDMSYRLDQPTPFVSWALKHQCDAQDGLGMLIEQAAASFYLWHGYRPDTQGLVADRLGKKIRDDRS